MKDYRHKTYQPNAWDKAAQVLLAAIAISAVVILYVWRF